MSREVVLEGTTLCTPGLEDAAANAASVAFRVLNEIGQGGMGIVYRAEQLFPHRTVALKVLKRAIADVHAKKRFAREAEITGRLNHRSIAQVFVAGVLKDGMPFMAMEFVHGMPLTAYAQDRRLSVNARLELMLKVCDAVAYAHRQGVVHRDLKPSNILVDESGEPRILDFGLAAEPQDAGQSLLTVQGQMVGTLDYMSPEQAEGRTQDIDEQSDVYGLGVLLYELLALRRPFDFSAVTLPDAVRAIRETAPPKLSTNNRALRGDLETIVGKALCKEKFGRYRSVEKFRADLRHWLDHEPIEARPPSVLYRSSRFVRKYRGFVSAVTAVIVALSTGLGVAIYEAVAARSMAHQVTQEKSVEEIKTAGTEILLGDKLAESGDPVEARKHYEHAWSLLENNHRSTADPKLAIWNLDQKYGQLIEVLEPSTHELRSMALSRDQKHLVTEYSDVQSLNYRVELRNPLNNKREAAFELPRAALSLQLSPDGQSLLTVESSDDLDDSHFYSSLYAMLPQPVLLRPSFEAARAAVGNDRYVYVDSSHYLKVAKLSDPTQERRLLTVDKVEALELNGSNVFLAQADGLVLRVNTDSGESATIASLGDLTKIRGIALSPNGDYAVIERSTGNTLVDLASGKQNALPEFDLTNGGFAADSSFYVFSTRRETVLRFDTTGKLIRTVPCYFNGQMAYSQDFVVTQDRNFALNLWATTVPTVSRALADPTDSVLATALSSDGYIAAVGSTNGTVLIKDAVLGHVLDQFQLDAPARYLAFDQATSRLLAISSNARAVDVYAIPGHQRVLHRECSPLQGFAFSADGKKLALGEPSDNQVEILSQEDDSWQSNKFSFSLREPVLGFSEDGRFLCVTNETPTVWHVDVPAPYRATPSELIAHPVLWRPAVILQRGTALRTVNAFDPNKTQSLSTTAFASDRFYQAVDEELCLAADSDSIAAFNPQSGQILREIVGQSIRGSISVSENGEQIFFRGSGATWLNFNLPGRLRNFEQYRKEPVSGAWTNAAAKAQWLAALGVRRDLLGALASSDQILTDNDMASTYVYWSLGQTGKTAQIIGTIDGLTPGSRALILSNLNVSTAPTDPSNIRRGAR